MARNFGVAKAQSYLHFYDCLVARTEAIFEDNWAMLMTSIPNKVLREYMQENWYKCRSMWALHYRRKYRLFGANTNNFVEAFFRVVKAAIHQVRRRRPHIAECIKLVLEFTNDSIKSQDYTKYLHESSELKVQAGEHQAVFDDLGRVLTDFAVRLLFKQLQVFQKTPYRVERFKDSFIVTNPNNERQFSVTGENEMQCDCDFACSYGMSCRHLMAVHAELAQPIVNPKECLDRHARILKDTVPIYHGALVGLAQMEDDDERTDEVLNQSARWREAGRVLKQTQTKLADLSPVKFSVALPRLKRILDLFIEIVDTIDDDEDPDKSFSTSNSPSKSVSPDKKPILSPESKKKKFVRTEMKLKNVKRIRGRPTSTKSMAAPKFNNTQNTNTQQDISTIKSQKIVAKRKRSPSVAVDNSAKNPRDLWKTFSRLKGSAGIPVDLLMEDYQMIETTSKMVYDRVLTAFSIVCETEFGSRFCGFGDPGDIAYCHPNSPEIITIQDSVDSGRPCLQALVGDHHFVLAHKGLDDDIINVYNSMDGGLGDHHKLQLSMLFGRENRDVVVRFPVVHKQSVGSNQCGPLVCCFMAEILLGKAGNPENIVFCQNDEQRQWVLAVLQNETLSICRKKGQGRRSKDALTEKRPQLTITPENAKAYRAALGTGPRRRISGAKKSKK